MRQQKRPTGSRQFWRKWQESIKGFEKERNLDKWRLQKKWQILGEKGKFRQKRRVCQKVIKASAKYSNKMTKRGILTNGDFTWKLQIWQEFIGLAKMKTRWQKRHVDNCGFYENDKFCEIGEFGFIKGLAKILSETTKEAFLRFATTRQGGNVGGQYNRIFLEELTWK